MTRDEFLDQYRGTIWEGGARYWRGEVFYRPTWVIVDLILKEVQGYWYRGPGPRHWFIVIERLDDNSRSQPRGTIQHLPPSFFEPFESFSGGATYRMAAGVSA